MKKTIVRNIDDNQSDFPSRKKRERNNVQRDSRPQLRWQLNRNQFRAGTQLIQREHGHRTYARVHSLSDRIERGRGANANQRFHPHCQLSYLDPVESRTPEVRGSDSTIIPPDNPRIYSLAEKWPPY